MILYRCFGSEANHTNASPAVTMNALRFCFNKRQHLRVTRGKSSVTERDDLEIQGDPPSRTL